MLCYLLLNHWTKSNQIWCASYSHQWGMQQHIYFCHTPGSLGRGQKVKYHLISITKSISRFLYQTLFVFSQIKLKMINNISNWIFILSPGSCPRCGTWGCLGVKNIILATWPCGISIWRRWWVEQNTSKIFTLWSNWWPLVGVKTSNIINFFASVTLHRLRILVYAWCNVYHYYIKLGKCSIPHASIIQEFWGNNNFSILISRTWLIDICKTIIETVQH